MLRTAVYAEDATRSPQSRPGLPLTAARRRPNRWCHPHPTTINLGSYAGVVIFNEVIAYLGEPP